eukprot:Em0018g512a
MARSESSAASTLVQPVRRFDLLISEHQTLVKTAQESVQQALEALENASSEDEKRAAKLQVQSLLQRADELVLTLKLATEVRKELAHAYKDISEAKEKNLQVERIQWLEQQMGKLILSRRRGRPAARGKRSMAPQNPDRGSNKREGCRYEGGGAIVPHATPQPSFAASSRLSIASKSGNGKNGGSVQSSHVSPSRDSDIWHSESEANWTNADAHSGMVGIDGSEASVPAEGERSIQEPASVMSVEPLSLLENRLVIMPSTEVGSIHKTKKDTFEKARPVLVFGSCSWNSLPLALTKHFVTSSIDAQIEEDRFSFLQAELEEVMAVLRSLRERVFSAAQASAAAMTATNNGSKSSGGGNLQGNKATKPNTTLTEATHESTLPPIQDLQRCSPKQGNKKTILYPRPATVWQVLETPAKSKRGLPKIRDKISVQRIFTKRGQPCNEIVASDLFEFAEHNQRHIEVLGHIATDNAKSNIVKSLNALGKYILPGSQELKIDLLTFIVDNKTCQKQECFAKYAALQKCLCNNLQDSCSCVSLHAAFVLSSMQCEKDSCVAVLKTALHILDSTHEAKALSCLVNTWHYWDKEVLTSALQQLHTHIDWRQRLSVAKDLRVIGTDMLDEVTEAEVFELLHQRLYDEPIEAVRCEIGQLMADLNMSEKAQTVLLGWLECDDEFKRGNAVVALGAFGAKTASLHSLLDCLELDPSIYVRVQVVRLLGRVKYNSHHVVNKLLEISKGSGIIARESQLALQKISCQPR